MRDAGFKSVAHVPCIFNNEWRYEAEASRYLSDRALLETEPSISEATLRFLSPRYPTDKSIETYGSALTNFLEWCEAVQLKWMDLEFTEHLVNEYQAQMLSGAWSVRNEGLAASTVNQRVDEACRFLQWAASRNLRKPFDVLTVSRTVRASSANSSIGHKPKLVQQRAGRVRPDPMTLRMPSNAEVASWMQSVLIEKGRTKALICDLICETGIRREEAAQWRVDTLPIDKKDWSVDGGYVTVQIKYGAKGQKRIDGSRELVGPSRFIVVPLELAEKLAAYRNVVRPGLRARYVRAALHTEEKRARMRNAPKRLFLSDFDGQPVSAASIYNAWTSVSKLPFPGWCPHQGRHYWACDWLLQAVLKRLCLTSQSKKSGRPSQELTATAMDVLMLEIKPQLGHVSEVTSERYLGWLKKAMLLTNVSDAYEKSIDSTPSGDVKP